MRTADKVRHFTACAHMRDRGFLESRLSEKMNHRCFSRSISSPLVEGATNSKMKTNAAGALPVHRLTTFERSLA